MFSWHYDLPLIYFASSTKVVLLWFLFSLLSLAVLFLPFPNLVVCPIIGISPGNWDYFFGWTWYIGNISRSKSISLLMVATLLSAFKWPCILLWRHKVICFFLPHINISGLKQWFRFWAIIAVNLGNRFCKDGGGSCVIGYPWFDVHMDFLTCRSIVVTQRILRGCPNFRLGPLPQHILSSCIEYRSQFLW